MLMILSLPAMVDKEHAGLDLCEVRNGHRNEKGRKYAYR